MKITLFIFFNFVFFLNLSAAEDKKNIKNFYLTCEGIFKQDPSKKEENFFQDINIQYSEDNSKYNRGYSIEYKIVSTSQGLSRPKSSFSARSNVPEDEAKAFLEIINSWGAGVIKDGWKNGVIEISGAGFKDKNSVVKSYSEVLNLNVNSLTIKVHVDLKEFEQDLIFKARARCTKNDKLMAFLNNLGKNKTQPKKDGTFKNILGKVLGK